MTGKKHSNPAIIILVLITGAAMFIFSPSAMACGFGNSGGADYVPQRQGGGASNQASAIEIDQARTIVSIHIAKLNPDLSVGNTNDSGGFFEVEIIDKNDEVIQLVGVDKYSGRMMLIN